MPTHPKPTIEHGLKGLEQIPVLEPGDRLTYAEFERRYDAMPELKKAELIEGVVHMPSPVRYRRHSRPDAWLISWLVHYESATAGVETAGNCSVRLDLDNEPQPDALLLIDPERGGQARISDDDYVEGPPELVAEVASSSISFDLNTKLHIYRRNGVREYLVWRVLDQEIDWFILRQGEYQRNQPDTDGLLKSEAFPGLWLDANALLHGDLPAVLAAVERGTNTPQHAAFVQRLNPATDT